MILRVNYFANLSQYFRIYILILTVTLFLANDFRKDRKQR